MLCLYPEEQDSDDFAPDVKWDCFEYLQKNLKMGNEKAHVGKKRY